MTAKPANKKEKAAKGKSTPERVANRIIRMIETGELSPGQKLAPQSELAKSFSVGISSIREAVNVLEVMGYLEVAHGRGMFVKEDLPLDKSTLAGMETDLEQATAFELFELRELLECHVVKTAVRRIDERGLDKLNHALEALEHNVGDKKKFLDADIEFHTALAHAVDCRATGAIIRLIHEQMHKSFDLVVTVRTEPYGSDAVETARQIVKHITDGDEIFAVRAMRRHLDLPKNAIANLRFT